MAPDWAMEEDWCKTLPMLPIAKSVSITELTPETGGCLLYCVGTGPQKKNSANLIWRTIPDETMSDVRYRSQSDHVLTMHESSGDSLAAKS